MNWMVAPDAPGVKTSDAGLKKSVPDGVWVKCNGCSETLYRQDLVNNLYVCPKCGHHERISARERLNALFDTKGKSEIAANVSSLDPLKFVDSKKYPDRVKAATQSSGEKDALVVMSGTVDGNKLVAACFEFEFMGGSMGSAVGERFTQGVQAALDKKAAFVCFTATGGARMQEGLFSLFQMAKTSSMVAQLAKAKLPFITVLTDPTMGGVSASFAFMGDVVIAEPGALIGFAGPRVIENTVREKLPEGFQRAEFLLKKGAVDMVLPRHKHRETIASLVSLLSKR